MIRFTGWNRLLLVLIIIGALNWGAIGMFRFDAVAALFGEMSMVSRIIYAVVGLCGLFSLPLLFRDSGNSCADSE